LYDTDIYQLTEKYIAHEGCDLLAYLTNLIYT
jgi:hypothetical protein